MRRHPWVWPLSLMVMQACAPPPVYTARTAAVHVADEDFLRRFRGGKPEDFRRYVDDVANNAESRLSTADAAKRYQHLKDSQYGWQVGSVVASIVTTIVGSIKPSSDNARQHVMYATIGIGGVTTFVNYFATGN